MWRELLRLVESFVLFVSRHVRVWIIACNQNIFFFCLVVLFSIFVIFVVSESFSFESKLKDS